MKNFWNGDPLTTPGAPIGMAEGMPYEGVHPKAVEDSINDESEKMGHSR